MNSDSKNTPPLEKTADLLEEDLYWSIIERALEATNDLEEMEQYLIDEIEKLTLRRWWASICEQATWSKKLILQTCGVLPISSTVAPPMMVLSTSGIGLSRQAKIPTIKPSRIRIRLADIVEEGNEYEFESLAYVSVEAL